MAHDPPDKPAASPSTSTTGSGHASLGRGGTASTGRVGRDHRVRAVATAGGSDGFDDPEDLKVLDPPWPIPGDAPATDGRTDDLPPESAPQAAAGGLSRAPVPLSHRTAAGRILGVFLIAAGLWTLFDANQLYQNALTSPFGSRRTVAIEILRPIAAVANALHISAPVNAADSALDRSNGPSKTFLPKPPPLPSVAVSRAPNDMDRSGLAPRPHSRRGQSAGKVSGTTKSHWPPALRQPTVAHPLVMLDVGDSIGEDLGFGLGDMFAPDRRVKVIQKGKIDTGLARPDAYDWPVALEQFIHQYHPGVVVMMMGANDDQPLSTASGGSVPTGTAEWTRDYRQRISLMMQEAVASGAHVLWVGLPPLDAPAVNSAFAFKVNQLAAQLASHRSGVTFVSSWSLLSGPKGSFVQYKKIDGSVQQIRYPDGVHLAPAGWDLLASYLLEPMQHAWRIDLHAQPLMSLG